MYTDIDIYPNGYNPCDGMRIDYTDPNGRRWAAVFCEEPITPGVCHIYTLGGEYLGDYNEDRDGATDTAYALRVAALIDNNYK